jgi:putative MATE family efflux protein
MATVTGVALGVLLALVASPLARLMGMSPEGEAAFIVYLRVFAFDVPFLSILVAGIACLRGSGDTFRPMRTMIIVNVVNLALGWALAGPDYKTSTMVGGELVTRTIVHNPFPFHMGVMGIALGMFAAHATGAVLIVWTLARGSAGLRLRRRRLVRPHWHTMRRIVRVGLPNFLETFGMWLGNFPIILMAGWIGQDLVGAHVLAIRIEALSFQPGFAVGIAAAALTGQYLGAGSPRLARRAILVCTGTASVIMGVMGILFITRGHQIVGILSPQKEHLDHTPTLLFITGMVQVPFAIGIVLRQAMRGAGDVKVVACLTWIGTYAARLPLAYLLSGVDIPIGHGRVIPNPTGLEPSLSRMWIGLCAELVIRAVLFGGRFVQGGWARARV